MPLRLLQHPEKECSCSAQSVQRYLNKISLLDRIDLHVEVMPVSFIALTAVGLAESSAVIRKRVVAAREYRSRGRPALNVLRSYLNIVLNAFETISGAAPVSERLGEKENKIIQLERLLELHFSEEKLPSFYASKLCISVNYLNRICNEQRQVSAGTIIRRRVVLEAERLLYHTTKTVSEVSAVLGFEHVSYFTTFFKKYMGLTPEAFRKKTR